MQIIWGKSRTGKGRGKEMNVPTLNIPVYKPITHGVYISRIKIDSRWYNSITYIGSALTFSEKHVQAETHIIGKRVHPKHMWISIRLLQQLRKPNAFKSTTALQRAMKKDIEVARKYFKQQ